MQCLLWLQLYHLLFVINKGERTDLAIVARDIRAGFSLGKIFEEHPKEFFPYYKGIERAMSLCSKSRQWKSTVFWLYGPTGTGKTRFVTDLVGYEDLYWKQSGHGWWDGYEAQTNVIIDDYRTTFCKFNELLALLDRYPYQLQVKGAMRHLLARRIFITSPYSPAKTWDLRTEEDLQQLERRVDCVVKFMADGTRTVERGDMHLHLQTPEEIAAQED